MKKSGASWPVSFAQGIRFVFERHFRDFQGRSRSRDHGRRSAEPETFPEPATLVEEERPAVRTGQVQRTAREQNDHRGFFVAERPGDLDRTRPVDEQEIAGQGMRIERVHPRAPGREQGPVRRPDVFFKRDGRIEQTGAADARGARCPRRVRGASTRSLTRASASRRMRASSPVVSIAFESGLDIVQQVGFRDAPYRAAHAEILRRHGFRREGEGAGDRDGQRIGRGEDAASWQHLLLFHERSFQSQPRDVGQREGAPRMRSRGMSPISS